ncbi:hypothetical protein EDB85DRAFT_2146822 [Lactarius pseudohatsudake]|nr:hypothetical protein EDB85DRAFT_2146822 [Lactarius pseudohatsudake]
MSATVTIFLSTTEETPSLALSVTPERSWSAQDELVDCLIGHRDELAPAAEYARLDGWLHAFWFKEDGASCTCLAIRDNAWPPNKAFGAVTMWLFWSLLRPGVLELPVFSIVFQG